jgi:hypothetical protein
MVARLYAISRIEMKPGIWCWAVLFRRRGKSHYKAFYDIKLGGSAKARAAAVAWRNGALAETPPLMNREFRQLKRSSNSSGAPGVHFIQPTNQPAGSWQARLKLPDGRERTKTFAVQKYGYRQAFDLALAERARMVSELEDRPFLHAGEARRFAAGGNPSP